jgi:NADH:ubiquinone oxidoreductase subunit H
MRIAISFFCLMLFCSLAFAIGDSIATTEGGLVFAIGVGVFIVLCLTIVIYFCLKIAGPKQRFRWALLGGLPSIACTVLYSWQVALAIAFGLAFWLQHTAEIKQRAELDKSEKNT